MRPAVSADIDALASSPTLAINEISNQLIKEGKTVYKLGLGQSPFPVPDSLVMSLQEAAREKAYEDVQGLPALRHAVAEHYANHHKLSVNASNVLIGPGSKELLFIIQKTFAGEILLPTPAWVSYEPQAVIAGKTVVPVNTTYEDRWLVTPDALRAACPDKSPRLMILNYPNNPTGMAYTSDELKVLADVCREYNITVVADEIYSYVNFADEDCPSLATYYPEGTIVSSGISKWCGAGGWRIGFMIFPDALKTLLGGAHKIAGATFSSVCSPVQYAAVRAYEPHRDITRYINHSRRLMKALCSFGYNVLSQADIQVHMPLGGFYLFPMASETQATKLRARGIDSSTTLAKVILDEVGVATVPGDTFGREPGEYNLRLALVNFDGEEALKDSYDISLDQDLSHEFLQAHCPDTIHGLEKLAEWFEAL